MRYSALPLLPVAAIALVLGGCSQPKEIYADKGWVRLSAVKGNPAVAYFTLHGGVTDATLVSVTSPVVIKTELHESMGSGGMSSMAPVRNVTLRAGTTLEFAPGGKHVMLFDVSPTIKAGDNMPLVFTFADNLRIQIDAPVVAAGDPPPKG